MASGRERATKGRSLLKTILCRPFRAKANKKLTQAKAWAIVLKALRAAEMPKPEDFAFIRRRLADQETCFSASAGEVSIVHR